MQVDLSTFNNSWYNPGRDFLTRTLWHFVNLSVIPSQSVIEIEGELSCACLGVGEGVSALLHWIKQDPGLRLPDISRKMNVSAKTLSAGSKKA